MEIFQASLHGQKEDRVETIDLLLHCIQTMFDHLHFNLLRDIKRWLSRGISCIYRLPTRHLLIHVCDKLLSLMNSHGERLEAFISVSFHFITSTLHLLLSHDLLVELAQLLFHNCHLGGE